MTESQQVENQEKPLEISQAELQAAHHGPAVFSNKFYITIGSTVRIAFTEQPDPAGPSYFRSAVMLSLQEAIGLKNLLHEMLKEPEEQLNKLVEQLNAAKQNG